MSCVAVVPAISLTCGAGWHRNVPSAITAGHGGAQRRDGVLKWDNRPRYLRLIAQEHKHKPPVRLTQQKAASKSGGAKAQGNRKTNHCGQFDTTV